MAIHRVSRHSFQISDFISTQPYSASSTGVTVPGCRAGSPEDCPPGSRIDNWCSLHTPSRLATRYGGHASPTIRIAYRQTGMSVPPSSYKKGGGAGILACPNHVVVASDHATGVGARQSRFLPKHHLRTSLSTGAARRAPTSQKKGTLHGERADTSPLVPRSACVSPHFLMETPFSGPCRQP